MKDIETLRAGIAALKAERLEIVSQPRSREDVEALVRELVSDSAERGKAAIGAAIARTAAGHAVNLLGIKGAAALSGAGFGPFSLDLGPLLVTLLGAEKVTRTLVDACALIPEGLPPLERQARLAAIEQDLDRLEREEEAAICALEAQGQVVMRRPDARPEIVLAC